MGTAHTLGLLGQAVWIMLFGMVMVFSFLAILIITVKMSEKIIKASGLDKGETPVVKPKKAVRTDDATKAAIAAAVHQHRKK